jgi:hypothetical protein
VVRHPSRVLLSNVGYGCEAEEQLQAATLAGDMFTCTIPCQVPVLSFALHAIISSL